MLKKGRKALSKKEKTIRVGYTVLERHEKMLMQLSEEEDKPMSAIVRNILDEYFKSDPELKRCDAAT